MSNSKPNPACALDPTLIPGVFSPYASPAERLIWACNQILELQGRVDDLEGRVAALEKKA